MSRSYIPSDLRQQVYARARGICEYCQLSDTVVLSAHQIDHIIAEKHGGATTLENLALSCTFVTAIKVATLLLSIHSVVVSCRFIILAKISGQNMLNARMLNFQEKPHRVEPRLIY